MSNPFANALAAGDFTEILACAECTIAEVNGDTSGCTEERAGEIADGWARMREGGADVTPGTMQHGDDCPGEGTEGCECECERDSWSRCDVCGEVGSTHMHRFLVVYVGRHR